MTDTQSDFSAVPPSSSLPPADKPITRKGERDLDEEMGGEGEEVEVGTILEALTAELQRDVIRPDITLLVPTREKISVRFSPNITHDQLSKWQKQAGGNSRKGVDTNKFGRLLLAHTNSGLIFDGVLVTDDGDPMTFRTERFVTMNGGGQVIEAISKFYSSDAAIDSAAAAVLEAAGYQDEAEESDDFPTNRSETSE